MNKAEIIEKIASETGFTKTIENKTINSFINSVIVTLKNENRFNIQGFCTFILTEKSKRYRRNSKIGSIVKDNASKHPKFIAGKKFKEIILR